MCIGRRCNESQQLPASHCMAPAGALHSSGVCCTVYTKHSMDFMYCTAVQYAVLYRGHGSCPPRLSRRGPCGHQPLSNRHVPRCQLLLDGRVAGDMQRRLPRLVACEHSTHSGQASPITMREWGTSNSRQCSHAHQLNCMVFTRVLLLTSLCFTWWSGLCHSSAPFIVPRASNQTLMLTSTIPTQVPSSTLHAPTHHVCSAPPSHGPHALEVLHNQRCAPTPV